MIKLINKLQIWGVKINKCSKFNKKINLFGKINKRNLKILKSKLMINPKMIKNVTLFLEINMPRPSSNKFLIILRPIIKILTIVYSNRKCTKNFRTLVLS